LACVLQARTPTKESASVRVLVSGWSGSTNLGDELVLAGLLRLLADEQVVVVSVDPAATRERFGIPAVAPREIARLTSAVREADLLVFGGGGLLQDETSPFNLPYHLARPALAEVLGTPVVGVGLGAGPLTRPGSRRLVAGLSRAVAVSVRDEPSRQLLAECGVEARLGADLALALDPIESAPEDVITVSLRPWGGGRGWLPVGARRRHHLDEDLLGALATGLDALSAATGLPVRFVALQADRDDEMHAQVAARMRAPTERRCPGVHEVVAEVAAGRLVVAMRFHAGIAAVLGGRPTVLLGYSPKVDALAHELGAGAALLPLQATSLSGLAEVGPAAMSQEAAIARARAVVQERLEVDRAVIATGLRAARGIG
jgi:polysaccharide pyruvyl transferase CsaB